MSAHLTNTLIPTAWKTSLAGNCPVRFGSGQEKRPEENKKNGCEMAYGYSPNRRTFLYIYIDGFSRMGLRHINTSDSAPFFSRIYIFHVIGGFA